MKTCIYCSLIKLGKHAPLPYVTWPRPLMATLCRGVSSSSTMTLFQHGKTLLALIRVIQSLSWAIMQTCFFNSLKKDANCGLYSWKCIVNDDLNQILWTLFNSLQEKIRGCRSEISFNGIKMETREIVTNLKKF